PKVRMGTVGRPLDGVQVEVDPFSGELLCRHEYGFEGYVSDGGRLVPPHEWFATRDLVSLDLDGRMRILGRTDQMVKRDGSWVSLAEIEENLRGSANVRDVAVIAAGNTPRGAGLVAFYVPATAG